jgi:hypothetical protein
MGSFQNPDETGVWVSTILGDAWPMPFNQIIWSGPPYQFSVFAQDSAGNVYVVNKAANICRPSGNTNLSTNTLGAGSVIVEVACEQASVFFQDQTNTSYQGLMGTQESSLLIMTYPVDQTNTQPTPFSMSNFASCLAPISYSAPGYGFTYYSIYQYYLQNNVYVNIGYRQQRLFPVLCNIDLCPLICDITGLMETIENGSCNDLAGTNNKLIQINTLLNEIMIGIKQPLCGVDVPGLIERIKRIGGFTCDCCVPGTGGITGQTSSVIGGYNFEINGTCGISGNITTTGNNITFNLSGKTYVFNLSNTIPTEAFTVTPATAGCNTTYSLNVNLVTLATDILTTIEDTPALYASFNALISSSALPNIVVNGGCLFASTQTYDYTYTLLGIPASATYAQLTSILVGGNTRVLNFPFNQANISALTTYLNSLNLGTWTATNVSGTVTLSSEGNTNALGQLTYSIGGTAFIAGFASTATGYTPVSIPFVVQELINAWCALNETNVNLDNNYQVPTITTNASGQYISSTISVGPTATTDPEQTLLNLLEAYITSQNAVISYVLGLGSVNCSSISAIFQSNTNLLSNQSLLYGTKLVAAIGQNPAVQSCAGITLTELFQYMLSSITDTATNELFCARVQACGAGETCTPFSNFVVTVVPHNTVCTNIVGISGTFS